MNDNINKKVIIFDRDGTLNEDDGYTYKIEKLKWKPGAIKLIKFLNEKKYFIFVATNQSGISRGIFSEKDMHNFHTEMQHQLKKFKAHIDKFYYCPYHNEGVIKMYKKDSEDRKPNIGMLMKAIDKWNINIKDSLMIGNSHTDYLSAKKTKLKYFYAQNNLYSQIKKIIK